MKRTGEILKKAREQKGLSISEIALSLKISTKVLKAIEDGDSSQLPAKTFLRGFVQSYANYLRLDVNEVLKIFQDEMGTTKPAPLIQLPEQDATLEAFEKNNIDISPTPKNGDAPTPPREKPFNSLAKNNNSKTVLFTFLGLILVGLIIFTKKMIDKYQKEGAVSEVEVTTPLATPSEGVSPDAAPNAEAALGLGQPGPSPMATAMSTPLASPASTSTPGPTPTATATPTPAPTPTPTPSPSASPSPSATPTNKPLEVIIEALDNVEIEFSTKDSKPEKINLTAEQVHTFKSRNGLRLNVSNGGAVNVIVNGKDLGIPGNLGKPVKLNF